ncbi:MAG TPA: cytochrome c biogenesis protein DipZ [Solirubrobacterales bacterium]|nr:cytochrome c biogenesis protein DipZ [Solirubrobacterales bacterium]
MALLVLFALLAGAGTALSPCVLPVLPAVLSAGVTGGRRRPLGVVLGLALSFTFATVALVYVIAALGLPNDITRTIAIVTLFGFGALLLVPPLADRVEAWVSRVVPGPARVSGDGFGSGLAVGASLGFVYAPCAGPILAGVITVSAAQDFTFGRLAVALAYSLGSAAVLYLLILGGRRITDRLAAYRGRIQVAMGAVMVAVAVVMTANLDVQFENAIARHLPSALVDPTSRIEQSSSVSSGLADLRGGPTSQEGGTAQAAAGERLPIYFPAPEFTDTQEWFNTPGGRSLSLSALRGHVVLVDFWTYTCINCIRTLPYIEAWYRKYRRDGLVVVGVHTPEFPFEREASNVQRAIGDFGITYPVVQDNDYATWTAYRNQYWPADYLIDAQGRVRLVHFGEGQYAETEKGIRSLLAEAGTAPLGARARARVQRPDPTATPESYLGAAKAQRFANGPIESGTRTYQSVAPGGLRPDELAYGGRWSISPEAATASTGASLELDFNARRVFCVLGSPRRPRTVRVLLDGRPIPDRLAGPDVHGATATISNQRLYRLVDLPRAEGHELTLEPQRGVSGYAFTFG